MSTRLLAIILILVAPAALAQSQREMLRNARADMDARRWAQAEATLLELARDADGEIQRESMFRLAGLKGTAEAATALYERVIDADPTDDWAHRSYVELAKIQYALGDYSRALELLARSNACGESDEACLFYGLSAVMLERFDDARDSLSRIRRGKHRTWAYLALAEVDMGTDDKSSACERYESLASAMISPTAIYRYAECLEDRGDVPGAEREYTDIVTNFRDTPEAVLAAEKLDLLQAAAPEPESAPEANDDAVAVLEKGFTVQFGSFRDRANAIKLASRIKRVFPGVRVDSELVRYREYHRVRYGYFKTREEAQAKGDEIMRALGKEFTVMTLP